MLQSVSPRQNYLDQTLFVRHDKSVCQFVSCEQWKRRWHRKARRKGRLLENVRTKWALEARFYVYFICLCNKHSLLVAPNIRPSLFMQHYLLARRLPTNFPRPSDTPNPSLPALSANINPCNYSTQTCTSSTL